VATAYDRQPDHLATSDGMGRCQAWFGEGFSFALNSSEHYHISMLALAFLGCLLLLFNFCTPWLALLWLGSSALCFVGAAQFYWIATARLLEQVVRVRPPVLQDRVRYFALWTTLAFQILLLSPIPLIFLQAFFWLIVRCFPADEEEARLWVISACLMLNLAIWVYVNIRLCFVDLLIHDQGMNFYSAMRRSWIMTGRRPFANGGVSPAGGADSGAWSHGVSGGPVVSRPSCSGGAARGLPLGMGTHPA
jgi:hypothetical protein